MLLVSRKHGDGYLDVVEEAFGKQRAYRPVYQAGSEDAFLSRASLTAEKAAGNLTCGVKPLLKIDGQRQKVHLG